MFPILIDLGRFNLPLLGERHLFLPTYGFLFASAVLLAWWWYSRRARTLGVEDELVFNQTFYTLLAGIFGAKLLLIIVDWSYYAQNPAAILGTLRSAGVLIGGVIAGAAVFSLYARRNEMPLLRLGDAIAAPLALAQSIGRLGCWSAGCCWGRHAAEGSRLAVTFTDPQAGQQTGVPLNVPLVPVQAFQMVHDLLLALLLSWLWRKRLEPAGTVFWIYVLFYSIGRGTLELWRGDVERGLWFGSLISTSQLFALGGIVFAAFMLIRGAVLRRRAAPA